MLITPNDLANEIGIKPNTLRKHISRGKLFRSGKFIDTKFEPNEAYILEHTNGIGINTSKLSIQNKYSNKNFDTSIPEVGLKEVANSGPNKEDIKYHSLNLRKKIADAEKAEKENELKTLELAKKMGELMPIEMVEKILTINIRHIIHGAANEWETIAAVYCEVLGGDRTHLSQMIEQMNKKMDKMIKEVKLKAGDEIKQVIKDYAEVRSRGQRK